MRVSATEASRGFSSLLSKVSQGETVEIYRHGEVVAIVRPARRSSLSGAEVLELLNALPRPDAQFAEDVASLGEVLLDPADPWKS